MNELRIGCLTRWQQTCVDRVLLDTALEVDYTSPHAYFMSLREASLRDLMRLDRDEFLHMACIAIEQYVGGYNDGDAGDSVFIMSYLDLYPFALYLNGYCVLELLCARLPDSLGILQNLCVFLDVTDAFVERVYDKFTQFLLLMQITDGACPETAGFALLALQISRYGPVSHPLLGAMINEMLPYDDASVSFAAQNVLCAQELDIVKLESAFCRFHNPVIARIIQTQLTDCQISGEAYNVFLNLFVRDFRPAQVQFLDNILIPAYSMTREQYKGLLTPLLRIDTAVLVAELMRPQSARAIAVYFSQLYQLMPEACDVTLRRMAAKRFPEALTQMTMHAELAQPARRIIAVCGACGVFSPAQMNYVLNALTAESYATESADASYLLDVF